jgi:hypothetical protein
MKDRARKEKQKAAADQANEKLQEQVEKYSMASSQYKGLKSTKSVERKLKT